MTRNEPLPGPRENPVKDTRALWNQAVTNQNIISTQMVGARVFPFMRRILVNNDEGMIAVDRFKVSDREPFGRMISATSGHRIDRPTGRLVLEHTAGSFRVDANVYATNRALISLYEMQFQPSDLQTEAAQESFAVTDQLGLGGQWTNGVLAVLRSESPSRIVTAEQLNDGAVAHMNAAVRHLIRG